MLGKTPEFQQTAREPLLEEEPQTPKRTIQLYDPITMQEITPNIAKRFVSLLSGDENAALALAAVTTGNVIDACFGVRAYSKTTKSAELVKIAKEEIDKANYTDARVGEIAVEVYRKGFETIIDLNEKLSQLNMITYCFCAGKIRHDAVSQLAANFGKLQTAIQEVSS